MIPYNLKKRTYKNHPKDGLFGIIQNGSVLSNYPVTIVDDSKMDEKGYALVLIHLAEDIRSYSHLTLHEDFLYLSFANPKNQPTYRLFDYTKRELTMEEIIRTLKKVVYDVSPQLQSQTCLGWSSGLVKDNPNRYTGSYLLNNEEEYKIIKTTSKVQFFAIRKNEDSTDKPSEELIYEEELKLDVYEKALEVSELKRKVVVYTNQLLDQGAEATIAAYYKAKEELNTKFHAMS